MPSIKFYFQALILISVLSLAGLSGCGDDANSNITKIKKGAGGGDTNPSNPFAGKPEAIKDMQKALNNDVLVDLNNVLDLRAVDNNKFVVRIQPKINSHLQDPLTKTVEIKVGDSKEQTLSFTD